MSNRAPAIDTPDPPGPPGPPDKGKEEPIREPPGQPGAPPTDPRPKGDPIVSEPTRLV